MSMGAGRYAGLTTGKVAKFNDDAKPTAPIQRVVFHLPYPPSVNRIWRAVGGRVILSQVGRRYRGDVEAVLFDKYHRPTPLPGRLAVTLVLYPPCRRKRDVDNACKAVLDALQHCRVFEDDEQVDELHAYRGPVEPPGRVEVTITPADPVRAAVAAGTPLHVIEEELEARDQT